MAEALTGVNMDEFKNCSGQQKKHLDGRIASNRASLEGADV